MHGPGIEDNDRILGDELAVVVEVFARNVRCPEPKRVVQTFDLQHVNFVKLDLVQVSEILHHLPL
jgi:tRNA U54 and U55 pseudouridine synthase Pus10